MINSVHDFNGVILKYAEWNSLFPYFICIDSSDMYLDCTDEWKSIELLCPARLFLGVF